MRRQQQPATTESNDSMELTVRSDGDGDGDGDREVCESFVELFVTSLLWMLKSVAKARINIILLSTRHASLGTVACGCCILLGPAILTALILMPDFDISAAIDKLKL